MHCPGTGAAVAVAKVRRRSSSGRRPRILFGLGSARPPHFFEAVPR